MNKSTRLWRKFKMFVQDDDTLAEDDGKFSSRIKSKDAQKSESESKLKWK